MKRAITVIAIVAVVAVLAGAAWWYVNENPEWRVWAQNELEKAVAELGLEPKELGLQRHVVKPTAVVDWTTSVVAGVAGGN